MEYLKVFSRKPARDQPSRNLQPQDLEKNGTAKGCFFAWPGKNPWSILVFGFGGTISTLPFGLGANAVGCFHKGISRENVFVCRKDGAALDREIRRAHECKQTHDNDKGFQSKDSLLGCIGCGNTIS